MYVAAIIVDLWFQVNPWKRLFGLIQQRTMSLQQTWRMLLLWYCHFSGVGCHLCRHYGTSGSVNRVRTTRFFERTETENNSNIFLKLQNSAVVQGNRTVAALLYRVKCTLSVLQLTITAIVVTWPKVRGPERAWKMEPGRAPFQNVQASNWSTNYHRWIVIISSFQQSTAVDRIFFWVPVLNIWTKVQRSEVWSNINVLRVKKLLVRNSEHAKWKENGLIKCRDAKVTYWCSGLTTAYILSTLNLWQTWTVDIQEKLNEGKCFWSKIQQKSAT